MLSNDVFTQLAIGYARQGRLTKTSADRIFQKGERSGAQKQSTRAGIQQIQAARDDKRSGSNWATISSLDGILRVHRSEKIMRDYLVANASATDIERELLSTAPSTNPLGRTTAWLTTAANPTRLEPRRLTPWDRIFENGSTNTVKSETVKARGIWLEAKTDPNEFITLFNIKETL
jgi:hypothetical protein